MTNSLPKPSTSCGQCSGMTNHSDVMTDCLDVRDLICKIKRRPGLWDTACPAYWDREIKKRLWEEIVELLLDREGTSNAEKQEFGNIIQKRWRNLRSSYARELHRLSKTNVPGLKSPYYYFNQLSFLEPTINQSYSSREDMVESDNLDPLENDYGSSVRHWPTVPKPLKKISVSEDDVKPFKRIKEEKEDEDKLFLLSLLNPMKSIPPHLRLSVHMELLQVIHRAQNNMTVQYAQVPLIVYQHHPPVFDPNEEAARGAPRRSVVAEADNKPTTQRHVVLHKLTPPSSPSTVVNSCSDAELDLFHVSA